MIAQLPPDEPLSPQSLCDSQAWRDDYPWLHQALKQIGPGAQGASERLRMRIEDELKTTLDFRVRPDGTAAIWCGMSGYDFHHYPTPKELLEGLAEAYRRELKRKMSAGARRAPRESPKPQPLVRTLPSAAKQSLARMLAAVLLLRVEQLALIFLAVTALTLLLSSIAVVR